MLPFENLYKWQIRYLLSLTKDLSDASCWSKRNGVNSPGWTLMHLIAEAEAAIVKLNPAYQQIITQPDEYLYGSDGNARADRTLTEIRKICYDTYETLNKEVISHYDQLKNTPIQDELLSGLLETELDFYLHLLTTHLAAHVNALVIWRKLEK